MTVSPKQLAANRINALKGGIKTQEGKDAVKYNALKHGLLAKEAVITAGEGVEDPAEFQALLEDLHSELAPVGVLEEMLVEKVAAGYWRLRRAYRFEVGLLRHQLDTVSEDFETAADWRGTFMIAREEELRENLTDAEEKLKCWKKDKRNLSLMHKSGESLEILLDWEANWEAFFEEYESTIEAEGIGDFQEWSELCTLLRDQAGWDDERIWKGLIKSCDTQAKTLRDKVARLKAQLEREKDKNRLRLEVRKKLGHIPSKEALDRLLRYETAINRQLYKALNELERMQRRRLGETVPPPIDVNIEANVENSE